MLMITLLDTKITIPVEQEQHCENSWSTLEHKAVSTSYGTMKNIEKNIILEQYININVNIFINAKYTKVTGVWWTYVNFVVTR